MSRNTEDKVEDKWNLSVGLYPGILVGVRTYDEPGMTTHVLYLPFVDLALEIYH